MKSTVFDIAHLPSYPWVLISWPQWPACILAGEVLSTSVPFFRKACFICTDSVGASPWKQWEKRPYISRPPPRPLSVWSLSRQVSSHFPQTLFCLSQKDSFFFFLIILALGFFFLASDMFRALLSCAIYFPEWLAYLYFCIYSYFFLIWAHGLLLLFPDFLHNVMYCPYTVMVKKVFWPLLAAGSVSMGFWQIECLTSYSCLSFTICLSPHHKLLVVSWNYLLKAEALGLLVNISEVD